MMGTMLFSAPFSILAETPSGPLALDVSNELIFIFHAEEVIWTATREGGLQTC